LKRICVAAAVIYDSTAHYILISLRPAHKHQGGLWEFPGGKIEQGESAAEALCRELEEELGIIPTRLQPLLHHEHDYPDKRVSLDVWRVHNFSGTPIGREGQQIKWVSLSALSNYVFPAANQVILQALECEAQC